MTTSVVAFVVRKGNPKNIKTWDDLLKPGVKVLTPNPFTSGAAKWNLLAAYGQASNGGKDPQAGLAYVRKLLTEHVPVQDKSGREALQNFTSGNGDVLLSYEYEATTAQKKGEDLDYVLPDDTIKIDIDIATTPRTRRPQAKTFLDYVLSKPGAGALRRLGLPAGQPGGPGGQPGEVPDPPGLFTIEDLGGWSKVNDEMFDLENGLDRQDRGGRGGLDRQVSTARPPTRGARPARPGALGARHRDAVAEPHRPAAAGRRRRALARRRPRRVLGRGDQPPGGRGAALHAAGLAGHGGDQRRHRAR